MGSNIAPLQKHEIAGRVAITSGQAGLPKVDVTTPASTAEIYLHGAHVTAFQKNGEPPLLFVSPKSEFADNKAIRGGVPIIFPWFGSRPGAVAHGFARLTAWDLTKTSAAADGSVKLVFTMPDSVSIKASWPVARVNFIVTVSDRLTMELAVANLSSEDFVFENCLHTYLTVGDINQVTVAGLQEAAFDDFAFNAGGARRPAEKSLLSIAQETNRVYFDSPQTVEVRDQKLKRIVRVEKSNSHSTIVWNPWTTQKMPGDWGADDYRQMICVESGNVKQNQLTLPANQTSDLKVVLSSQPLP